MTQFITSPNTKSQLTYDPNRQCVWDLVAENSSLVVQITFLSFETEPCCDYVQVGEKWSLLS